MSPTPVAVPTHVAVSVSVAEGRVDNDDETWSRLKADYRQAAALVDYSSVPRANGARTSQFQFHFNKYIFGFLSCYKCNNFFKFQTHN